MLFPCRAVFSVLRPVPFFLLAIFAGKAGSSICWAEPLPEPVWAGEAIFLSHDFPTADLNPFPSTFVHPHGADALASFVYVGEEFGYGWWDPADYPASFTREDSGGSWDLGQGSPAGEGRLEIPIPLGAAAPDHQLDFWVNVIRYAPVGDVPHFSLRNQTVTGAATSDVFLETRTPGGGGFPDSWHVTTWTGTVAEVTAEPVSLIVHAHAERGTIVDSVQVWAKPTAIPEPNAQLVAPLLCLILAVTGRARSTRKRFAP